MSPKMNEKDLLKRIADLPREVEPGNDPWDRIAARLDEPRTMHDSRASGSRARLLGWPARAVAAVAVLSIALAFLGDPAQQAGDRMEQAAVPPVALTAVLAGSEAVYLAAFREYLTVGESRDALPALTVEKIETGWSELRQVESALADALAQNPNDPFLNRRMLELRSRQLGFLRQLASLDQSNRRLTI